MIRIKLISWIFSKFFAFEASVRASASRPQELKRLHLTQIQTLVAHQLEAWAFDAVSPIQSAFRRFAVNTIDHSDRQPTPHTSIACQTNRESCCRSEPSCSIGEHSAWHRFHLQTRASALGSFCGKRQSSSASGTTKMILFRKCVPDLIHTRLENASQIRAYNPVVQDPDMLWRHRYRRLIRLKTWHRQSSAAWLLWFPLRQIYDSDSLNTRWPNEI